MTVRYSQVQTPLACVHFVHMAKSIHGNDPQSLMLLMQGHKKPYLIRFGGNLTISHHVAIAIFLLRKKCFRFTYST